MANTSERSFEGLAPEASHGIGDGFNIGGNKDRIEKIPHSRLGVAHLLWPDMTDTRALANFFRTRYILESEGLIKEYPNGYRQIVSVDPDGRITVIRDL